jgi:hypothetical protein
VRSYVVWVGHLSCGAAPARCASVSFLLLLYHLLGIDAASARSRHCDSQCDHDPPVIAAVYYYNLA